MYDSLKNVLELYLNSTILASDIHSVVQNFKLYPDQRLALSH